MFAWWKRYQHWLHTQWPAGEVEKLPIAGENGLTNHPEIRIAGDLTGIPLLKFSSDTAARAVAAIAQELSSGENCDTDSVDLAIIGGGVAGISAAIEAQKRGLSYLLFEAATPFATVEDFPRAKPIYTYPSAMTPSGGLQYGPESNVKEGLLEELRQQMAAHSIEPLFTRIDRLERQRGRVIVHPEKGKPWTARRAIVAIGRSGNYRSLGVPGEDLPHVHHRLHDPRDYAGQNILVIGGGDSALESATALAAAGAHVTLSYRRPTFARPKAENITALQELAQTDPEHLGIEMESQVKRIEPTSATLTTTRGEKEISTDTIFAMTGREAPLDFFRRSGICIAGETRAGGWLALGAFLLILLFVYTWKSGAPPQHWLDPWPGNMATLLSSLGEWWSTQVADRSTLLGTLAVSLQSRSFYYTALYSICVVIFGIQRIRTRRTPYITVQTSALMSIQVIPLFLLPEIILPWLGYQGFFHEGWSRLAADNLFELYLAPEAYDASQWSDGSHPRAYWRAYGFILAWPLMIYNVFTDSPMLWWLAISFLQTFVLIPLILYRWGKGAYCGWICSCGALAETLGDRQRHKMPHGARWNRLNMVGQVILGIAFLLLLWRILGWIFADTWIDWSFFTIAQGHMASGSVNYLSYKWIVDVLIAGVLGVGLYFKYSGRVWCRFACPLAALMHLYTRFSRFRIFSDKSKCISCNLCTATCHQGIDVMNFANKGIPMEDPQCVRCSACVQQCPTGVLSFGYLDSDRKIVFDRLSASPVQMREKS